ncbi:MAG: GNAT family N-acetyltransferase [Anaerolineae bacterium]|nr:GNAT family N-acetyltransferase [Anaerolineae bacterium]
MNTWIPSASFPILCTQRLLLREFAVEDIPAVFGIFSREDVNTWTETDTMRTMEEAKARVINRMNLFKDRMGIRWAITLLDNPKDVIGSCGYFSVRRGTQTVETGYDLHPDYWNKGLMTEALREMIRFSFGPCSPVPIHRMEALVMPENIASIRVLEKLGFEREGRRREFGFWKGRYQDVDFYALLNRGGDPILK